MASSAFSRLPGFRDFAPEDFALRSYIFDAWRRVSRRYGFLEYDGPPLEPLGLYVEKSGEEIVGQLYNFVDKGDRGVSLRPEMTPSLARILGDRSRGMSKPIRWFSIPQLFRYERQQRGRLREHFQLNVDIVGEGSVAADVEIVAVSIDALRELGLTAVDFYARVSDRRLLTAVLNASGIDGEGLQAAFGIVDKMERAPKEKSQQRLVAECGLTEDAADALLTLLDTTGLDQIREHFGEDEAVATALEPLSEYLVMLEAMGLGDYVEVDLRIVRGLAYYTGIVFELFDRKGELRAICGGGRYDRLLEFVGGDPLPAVGFGMGDVVLGELLKDRGLLPEYERAVDYYLVIVGEEERTEALRIATRLRAAGHSVAYGLREQGVGKQMKAAAKEGARQVFIVGPDELARGSVMARDMVTGEEREIALDSL
ncbi:MAG: histidine--tRNA ligase [Gemmatimonadales bacterium]|jgi:histidyl-tRNA synthetase|nr:histidine--tRNA ligase [Gemmatimonadales bacterium]MDG2240770.1 histidine--tRNA ligase [Longimicrobiales bacterium]MBT3498870.1 histidine--tRNA ligase [Gemmatimonadales bacterium]MBT3775537.1 histidine--tRNA ligase [Gemmatimonadales bacterium]MBT3957348.1 histidine--tRNA ligase [Gemmatimonadales bacterium]